MTKPIFLIGLKKGTPHEALSEISKSFHNTLLTYDYHVLVFASAKEEESFKLFSVENIDESEVEELKEYIKDKMKNLI